MPVRREVAAASELLGIDPLYVANEGKFVAVVAPEEADRALAALHSHPLGTEAAAIGEIRRRPGRARGAGDQLRRDPHCRHAGRRPVAPDLLSSGRLSTKRA